MVRDRQAWRLCASPETARVLRGVKVKTGFRGQGAETAGPKTFAGPSALNVVVLVKPVPESKALVFDRSLGRLDRGGVLAVDRLGQAALAWGISLRRPEENLRVLAMAPAHALSTLQALALGVADGVFLVSDPALAGADALATAEVLAAALRRMRADVAIFGAFSGDGRTGQVAPMTAGVLGWPIVRMVDSLHRTPSGRICVHRALTSGRLERILLPVPCVLTVERPPRRRKAVQKVAGSRQWERPELEVRTLADLGLSAPTSETRVLDLGPSEIGRTPQAVDGGDSHRVRQAMAEAWRRTEIGRAHV